MQEEMLKGYRLSPQQRHLWGLQRREGRNTSYQTKCAVTITGQLEISHLKTAAQDVMARHEILRTTFRYLPDPTIPAQVIEETGNVSWQEDDLSGLDQQALLIDAYFHEAFPPVDFERGPFLRLHLIKRSQNDYVMIVRLPAICADARSLRNLVWEIGRSYAAIVNGEELPDEAAQYADLAEWQNELIEAEEMSAGREYWRKRNLLRSPALQLAFEGIPASEAAFEPRLDELVIEPSLVARIESFARGAETSLERILLACWHILLWRHTGQSEIEVGTLFDGRRAAELEQALGLFAKYLPVTSQMKEGLCFSDLIQQLDQSCLTAQGRQEYFSWEQLVEPHVSALRERFFPFCFEPETAIETFPVGALTLAIFKQYACIDRFKIKLSYAHGSNGLVVAFHYDSTLFRPVDIRCLMGHFQTLLGNAIADYAMKVGEMEMIADAERGRLLFEYNATETEWQQDKLVHELICEQARRTPEAVAVIYEEEWLTYRQLNERADKLAHYLRGLGVGPEALVGISMERSPDLVVSLLAVLKAGGAYLPLDPSYPQGRLSFMLEDAMIAVLLTQTQLGSRLPPARQARVIYVDAVWESISQIPARACEPRLAPDNLAYVIYTSGSTGKPKGVMLRHLSLRNYLLWAVSHYPLEVGCGAPVHSSLSFDLTITALYTPLLVGGYVHLLSAENDIEALGAALNEGHGYSLVKLTPAHLQLLAEQLNGGDLDCAARSLVIGGENLPTQTVRWWRERAATTRLFNEYGPTESVVGCSVYEVGARVEVEAGRAAVPIGRPIANTRLYILDGRQQPLPHGIVGELCIAGQGLARGYLNHPDLTAEKFAPSPYSEEAGARLYRAGDLARYLRDGEIECLGRIDEQVKIRGYRVELGEIEAALRERPEVREAVVAVASEGGQNRLVGYVVGDEAQTLDVGQLRSYLQEHLPEYLIPAALITLDALPLTANGKIDRKRLPSAKDTGRRSAQEYAGARTLVEELAVGIFEEVLKLDRVGIHDNFFEIGGHSLLATQVISRVRSTFGVGIGVSSIFRDATAAGLARRIEEAIGAGKRDEAPPLVRAPREGRLPLSFAQQRLWFLDHLAPNNPFYNIPGAVRLEGRLDRSTLESAINEIVRRHEVLRTRIEVKGGEPAQMIDEWEPRPLDVEDLTRLSHGEREAEARRIAREEAQTGFDLRLGPMLRIKLLKLAEEDHLLLSTMHHIVSDAWSVGILAREVCALYQAISEGRRSTLPEFEIQYADYAKWQREYLTGAVLENEVGYWKERLKGAPVVELPTDHPRPAIPSHRGGASRVEIAQEVREGLRRLTQREGATLFMVLMAAFKALLMRYSGEEDVTVGTSIANRTRREVEGLIGFFINTLALRTDLGGNPSFRELIRREREVCLGAYAHQEAPFEKLVEEINPDRDLSRNPLFQAMLELHNTERERLEIRGLKVKGIGEEKLNGKKVEEEVGTAKFDLLMILAEGVEGIAGSLEYSLDLYDGESIRRMARHYEKVLAEIVRDAEQRIKEFELLSGSEREQILVKWNETRVEGPGTESICELFEEQVERTPETVAVVFRDQRVTYRELDARANRLAGILAEQGVGPEVLVAMLAERGIDFLTTMLAIFKAGGAYLPLDPRHPPQRIGQALSRSGAGLVMTASKFGRLVAASVTGSSQEDQPEVLFLEEFLMKGSSEEKIGRRALPRQLAYVIYTSGSTGVPKGAMIEHRGMLNHLLAKIRDLGLDRKDVIAQTASQCFDISVWQFLAGLLVGGAVEIFDDEITHDPGAMLGQIELGQVTIAEIVPSMMKMMLREAERRPMKPQLSTLRWLIPTGEALPPELCRSWFGLYPEIPLMNAYGPTECSDDVTHCRVEKGHWEGRASTPIGRPIGNTQIYVLNGELKAEPIGIVGELCIGGDGVGRGYLNDAGKTSEYFAPAPYGVESGGLLYKSGDLARYLSDGNLEYLGRIDHQVKIRGYRIELGEIEAALVRKPAIKEAVVVARDDVLGAKGLVAYVVSDGEGEITPSGLRGFLMQELPEYMVPTAYVALEALPLTENGKLDRRALPAPEDRAYAAREYEAPVGETEIALARIWAETLKVERVGRSDHFFELGGHSLLAVGLIERMRQEGLQADVRMLFATPTLAALAAAVSGDSGSVEAPPNLIPAGAEVITPEMLPLAQLRADDIEQIVSKVPGGAPNVQDIYPLAPLQEGILFHSLMAADGDPYLVYGLYRLDTRDRLDQFLQALQAVIDRHDILRTAIQWEGLPEPVQVVWRQAPLIVEEISVDQGAGDVARQLRDRFDPQSSRIDIRQAPMMRVYIAHDELNKRWVMLCLHHHLSMDHTTIEVLQEEILAHLHGQEERLSAPLPFRNYVVQARLGISRQEHEAFFREMLSDVDEPTAPFGLADVHGDGSGIRESRRKVGAELAGRLREKARGLGVSPAVLFHLAWAQVLARVSGKEDVVFGTVLIGRLQGGAGADRALGMFINTLPVRIRIDGESVEERARQTHRLLAQLLRHEHAPLALAQRCSAIEAPAPLFSALLNYRHTTDVAQTRVEDKPAWEGIEILAEEERTNYPVNLNVDDYGEGFALNPQVRTPIDPDRICGYMQTALEELVEALEREPGRAMRALNVMPAAERYQLLVEWNETGRAYPQDRRIHELIEEQVEWSPEAVAIAYGGRQVSYAELNARANRVARRLRRMGVGAEALVGVCVGRSVEMVVGLLGILKAGGAYVPLDPSYPAERLGLMMEDAGVEVVLTQGERLEALPKLGVAAVALDTGWEEMEAESGENLEREGSAENAAYVIYTSGSTGRPKGVVVAHDQVVNFFTGMDEELGPEAGAVWLAVTSISFDISVLELFWTLARGFRVVVGGEGGAGGGISIVEELKREQVTRLQCTPSMAKMVCEDVEAEEGVRTIRKLMIGGEAFPAGLGERLKGMVSGEIHNLYGPTETTIWSTGYKLSEEEGSIPIGRPIANTRIYLLDEMWRPTPVGVAGEVYIGGKGVARGYLKRGELTAERFVPDEYDREGGGRLYRTGDLGRYLDDGKIEFLGRIDHQIKIRGFRIELGEIEAQLSAHPGVGQCVVVAYRSERSEDQLVAYVVCKVENAPSAGELRSYLKERLPEYMAPAKFVWLERMPLTPNGKVDRRALPAPEMDRSETAAGYLAPRTLIEDLLVEIFSEVLRLDRVSVNDNFFELGGHSLLATQVVSRVRRSFGIEIRVSGVFEEPTARGLAGRIDQAMNRGEKETAPPLVRVSRDEKLPLSFAQQRLWFLDQLAPNNPFYNIPGVVRLEGQLRLEALERAINEIVRRHEALRTRIEVEDGVPAQVIDAWEPQGLEVIDLTGVFQEDRAAEVSRMAREEAETGFDLNKGPLLRVKILRLGGDDHVVLFTMHHIVSDAWSMGIMMREVRSLYQAYSAGSESPLAELPIQYADFAVWQREWLQGEVLELELEYWRRQLAGVESLKLPTDRPRPAVKNYRGAQEVFLLEAELTAALRDLSRREGVTLFMTLLAAFQALLYRYTGQEDIVVGTPIANRNRLELEGLIGFFVNTLALRGRLSSEISFRDLVQQVRETALAAYSHDQIPFEKLVEELTPKRMVGQNPLFQVGFFLDNTFSNHDPVSPEIILSSVKNDFSPARLDLTLILSAYSNGIGGAFTYATELFEPRTISSFVDRFQSLLWAAVSNPNRKLLDIPLTNLREIPVLTETNKPNPIDEMHQAAFVF